MNCDNIDLSRSIATVRGQAVVIAPRFYSIHEPFDQRIEAYLISIAGTHRSRLMTEEPGLRYRVILAKVMGLAVSTSCTGSRKRDYNGA